MLTGLQLVILTGLVLLPTLALSGANEANFSDPVFLGTYRYSASQVPIQDTRGRGREGDLLSDQAGRIRSGWRRSCEVEIVKESGEPFLAARTREERGAVVRR
jgi:hypothetical protein